MAAAVLDAARGPRSLGGNDLYNPPYPRKMMQIIFITGLYFLLLQASPSRDIP